MEALSKRSFHPHLQLLDLGRIVDNSGGNKVGDEAIIYLEKFKSLTHLYLPECWIEKKGVEMLSEMYIMGSKGGEVGEQEGSHSSE